MRLVVISGRSGSGKSTLLRSLEDGGFNCIDNFPVHLLSDFVASYDSGDGRGQLAVSIDVRNPAADLANLPSILEKLDSERVRKTLVFLDARQPTLVKRFSDTRRKHPLIDSRTDLLEALEAESQLLAPIAAIADLRVDSTNLAPRDLLALAQDQITHAPSTGLVLILRSFGYKHGVPVDADFVFDVRCLPNPFWVEQLRELTGLDQQVQDFFAEGEDAGRLNDHICQFLEAWLPVFAVQRRIYVSVALGCTGGRHRSVYMVERIASHFRSRFPGLLVRHREA